MSQLTNATRPNKKTLPSPIISTKSLPPHPPPSSSSSSSSLTSLMKLKQRNRRGSGSLPDKKSNTLSSRPSLSSHLANQRTRAREIVSVLQQKNIKLVAIDFDNTFLSIHTGGYYQGTVESLLEHIRPSFFHLVQELLDSPAFNQTLHVCIVSFSSQEQLIRRLLQLAFKTS
jgi:hypothetical protein